MLRNTPLTILLTLGMLTGCASRSDTPVEDLGGGHEVSRLALQSVTGTRDGDRLNAVVQYGPSNSGENLRVQLQFHLTRQAKLAAGVWKGLGSEGSVRERAVTFLGGQSGPPSLGGRFDLIDPEGRPLYRVSVPVQPLKTPL